MVLCKTWPVKQLMQLTAGAIINPGEGVRFDSVHFS